MERDENLRRFATDSQWEKLEAYWLCGSDRRAAEKLGTSYSSVKRARDAVNLRAARHGYSPDNDLTHPVPDGFSLKGTSTLYNRDGEISAQWVKTKEDTERQLEMMREGIEAMASELPRVKPTSAPESTSLDLMAGFPVGDHHLGMYAWGEEAGGNYDINIAERIIFGAIDHLTAATPSCEQAVVAFLGDFMHYDSMEAVTPTGRNPLDADGRFSKMVRSAIRSMRYVIQSVLSHHARVHIVVEIGNHDIASSVFLMECLSNIYEEESRVTVDTSPAHFHYFDFGANLIGVHHGHSVKLHQLPLIMATDRPEQWGKSKYRSWWTGHIHQDKVLDVNGCRVESFRVLPPTDAWAQNKGYRSQRSMSAIVLHREHGEVARHTVNPAMLE